MILHGTGKLYRLQNPGDDDQSDPYGGKGYLEISFHCDVKLKDFIEEVVESWSRLGKILLVLK